MTNHTRPTSPLRGYDWPWRRLRKRHLAQYPWCVRCGARGEDVDHVVPVRIAPGRRLDPTNLRTYCHSCHSKMTQWNDNPTIERNPQRGATETGLPLDPTHPWLGGTAAPPIQAPWAKVPRQDEIADEIFQPTYLKPSIIPLTMVCGCPVSGKSTWVRERKGPGDIVIDLDEVFVSLGYQPRTPHRDELRHGLHERNRLLATLAVPTPTPTHRAAWFVIGAPTREERARWAAMLKPNTVIVLAIQPEVCIKRVMADPARVGTAPQQVASIQRWWASFSYSPSEQIHCVQRQAGARKC